MFKAMAILGGFFCCSAAVASAASLDDFRKVQQYNLNHTIPHIDMPNITAGNGGIDKFMYPDGNTIKSAQYLWRLANEGNWSEMRHFLHYLQQPLDIPFASNGLAEEFKDVLWPKHRALNKPLAENASLHCEESTHV